MSGCWHDWTDWHILSVGFGRFRGRRCRTCGHVQNERVPTSADDLLERVLIAQLPDDCDSCDPGDCQCSVGRKDG